jgi:phosphate transport system permease protein
MISLPAGPQPGFEAQLNRRRRWKTLLAKSETLPWNFHSADPRVGPKFFTGLTGLATALILLLLAVLLGYITQQGAPGLSWHFLSSGTGQGQDSFDTQQAGVLPMIVGTAARVLLMTIFVLPVGVITAVYLNEYAASGSWVTRVIRTAVNNLAGVPSIVFGLFGLGFFINFVGGQLDQLFLPTGAEPLWGQPALLWASLTLAVMTLPVVIVATEESLRSIPPGLREGSLALGATRLQTIVQVVLPQALPGILTGAILAVSRAAGEVAPILFTGAAYYMATLPKSLTDQFMDLGYHVFVLSTQSPNVEKTRPILFSTVLVLLLLTFALNAVAILLRARLRRQRQMQH